MKEQDIKEAMTPKEKAEELYDKIDSIVLTPYYYGCEEQIPHHAIKECLNIFVDEILDVVRKNVDVNRTQMKMYWQEVKNEIEKL